MDYIIICYIINVVRRKKHIMKKVFEKPLIECVQISTESIMDIPDHHEDIVSKDSDWD